MKKQPATGDNMEGIMVISQTEKDKYCYDLTYRRIFFKDPKSLEQNKQKKGQICGYCGQSIGSRELNG